MTCQKLPRRGFVALIVVLVITAIATAVLLSVSFSGLGELTNSILASKSETSFVTGDACVEETLLRLGRNSGYNGGNLTVGQGSCVITVVVGGAPDERVITAQSTYAGLMRNIEAKANVGGASVVLTSWKEIF